MPRTRFAAPIVVGVMLAIPSLTAPAQAATTAPGQTQADTPSQPSGPAPLRPGDAFGEEVMLPARTIIFFKGQAKWSSAFETLVDAFKSLREYMDKQDIKPTGAAMTIYRQTGDTGFQFEAALPIAEPPKDAPKGDIAVGQAPTGKALKFVHRGSYDAMDTTYEAITNYLDDKQLEAEDLFIEEYITDPITTNPEYLVVNVFVPIK